MHALPHTVGSMHALPHTAAEVLQAWLSANLIKVTHIMHAQPEMEK